MPIAGDHTEEDEVAKLKDGRHIAMGKSWINVTGNTGSGNVNVINVRVPGLREIEYILQVQFYTDPITYSEDGLNPVNKKITYPTNTLEFFIQSPYPYSSHWSTLTSSSLL